MTAHRIVTLARRGASLVAVWLALSTSGSFARNFVSDHLDGPAVLVHGTGAAGTLNVVILGDGFTLGQMDKYQGAVNRLVTKWMATEPFKSVPNALTIYRLDVISDEQGIDVPDPAECGGKPWDDPKNPFARSVKNPNNVLETHWCVADPVSGEVTKRFLGSDGNRVSTFAAEAPVVPNLTIVIVNDWMFGATAFPDDGVAYVSLSDNLVKDRNPNTHQLLDPPNPASYPIVAIHEIGHLAPFSLLDEYSGTRPASELILDQAVIDKSPNLSTDLSKLPWKSLLSSSGDPLIDCGHKPLPKEIGAVIGGYKFATGVFHPSCSCKMESFTTAEYCLVCRQRIRQQLEKHVPAPH